ncbi:hypothetical protein B0A48_12724 [Cryoendolithus antarcticus]|uniref:Uncharacterized protein n=1 Tax=Cryoendolithus antarcticus TaxID=1507870 RepID=A0A1V8SR80_9PEZI|nr:hypothetical protein B0A48_12724 [Cryoendolithus antarcticus]
MEPDKRYYEPFIKPLLDAPGSAYRHTLVTGAHANAYWDNYRQILDDPVLMPTRPKLDVTDPRTRKVDTSMLFIGNLWRHYESLRLQAGNVKYEPLILQHMTYAALTNEIFQRNGLVRMLWWVPETCKQIVFSEHVRARTSYTVGLTMGASVEEVAGVTPLEKIFPGRGKMPKRDESLDVAASLAVAERMADSGMRIPLGREMTTLRTKPDSNVKRIKERDLRRVFCYSEDALKNAIAELESYLELFANFTLRTYKDSKLADRKNELAKQFAREHVRYDECFASLENRVSSRGALTTPMYQYRAILLMDLHLRVINIEANFSAVAEQFSDSNRLVALRKRVLAIDKQSQDLFSAAHDREVRRTLSTILDDIISFHTSPQMIPRDSRSYEPLQIHPDEFWPNYNLMLLDIVPKTRDLAVPEVADRKEAAKFCQELLKHLYLTPAQDVVVCLDRLAPNAAKDLIPMVPAITDARRGGRLDPGRLSVRMMTEEMIEGLVKAFLEWPFRPSNVEMALAGGEGTGGPGKSEDDGDSEA